MRFVRRSHVVDIAERPTLFTTLDGHCRRYGTTITTVSQTVAVSRHIELT